MFALIDCATIKQMIESIGIDIVEIVRLKRLLGRYGERFLHYPFNLEVLPKMFDFAGIFIFVFIGSYLIAVSISIIAGINNGEKVKVEEK